MAQLRHSVAHLESVISNLHAGQAELLDILNQLRAQNIQLRAENEYLYKILHNKEVLINSLQHELIISRWVFGKIFLLDNVI